MTDRRVVLVTGATGRIGKVIIPLLLAHDRYELRSGHRRTNPDDVAGLPNPVRLELDDYDSVLAALEGVDTVVHLAANSGDRPFREEMVPNNIIGPYHLCEAAVAAGCRGIIFASTNHVVHNYFLDGSAIGEEVPYRPDNIYGVTKAYGEVLGRFYVERRGLPSFISLRIGWFLAPDSRALRRSWHALHMWLSPRDCVQLIERCIDAPDDLGYACFHAISGNRRRLMSIDEAVKRLGYRPEDDSERHIAEFEGEIPEFLVPRSAAGDGPEHGE